MMFKLNLHQTTWDINPVLGPPLKFEVKCIPKKLDEVFDWTCCVEFESFPGSEERDPGRLPCVTQHKTPGLAIGGEVRLRGGDAVAQTVESRLKVGKIQIVSAVVVTFWSVICLGVFCCTSLGELTLEFSSCHLRTKMIFMRDVTVGGWLESSISVLAWKELHWHLR